MKKSNYIISTRHNNQWIYYNLINGNLIIVEDREIRDFLICLNNPNFNNGNYWQLLRENEYIVDDAYDELEFIKKRFVNKTVESNKSYHFTIAPSFKCNSSCLYCFQGAIERLRPSFSSNDWKTIEKFLTTLPASSNIHFDWYGGEPMLHAKEIEYFSNKLSLDSKRSYSHSISTNCTIFDNHFLDIMIQYGLKTVNTTLAGLKKTHELLRPTTSCSFERIVSNILRTAEKIDVVVSINLCNLNLEEIEKLLDFFVPYKDMRIFFSFSKIYSSKNNDCKDIQLSSDDYISHAIKFSDYALNMGLKICDMSCFDNDGFYCPVYQKNTMMIGPKLALYKCVDNYDYTNAFGVLTDGGIKMLASNNKQRYEKPCFDEECLKCKILPYCNGGCAYLRNIGQNPCPDEKNHLQEYLRLYYRKKYETETSCKLDNAW